MSPPGPGYDGAMDPDTRQQQVDDRLVALEVKASFADDLLDRLNDAIVRQQRQIDQLVEQVARLKDQLARAEPQAGDAPHDDRPPHY